MRIASQINLRRKLYNFHKPKLAYIPTKANVFSTLKFDKIISQRTKTQPKKQLSPQTKEKSFVPNISKSYKVLPTIKDKSLISQYQNVFSYHKKVTKQIKKIKPENGSKTLIYQLKTQGEKQFNKSRNKLRPQDSLVFKADEFEQSKRIHKQQNQLFEIQIPKKDYEIRKDVKRQQFLDKITHIRTMSKKLKQKSDKLHMKFQQINNYTNQQYQKLCKKNTSTKRYVKKKMSDTSLSSYQDSQY